MSEDRDALTRIRELEPQATPGPWWYDGRDIFTRHESETGRYLVIPLPEAFHESGRVSDADARLICELRNIAASL